MAARDAWEMADSGWAKASLFPVTFPLQLLRHSGYVGLHALDLIATPLHLFNQLEPAEIYARDQFPMTVRTDVDLLDEGEEMATWGLAAIAGVVIGHWFALDFVPGLFEISFL